MSSPSTASATPLRQVRVVAALISHPSAPRTYLVQQRAPGGSRPLLWEFPGGKVEAGETDAQALIRECREELAVELNVGAELWQSEHRYPDLSVTLVILHATIASGEPQNLGAHALRFATDVEMKALPFCEADVPFIELLVGRQIPNL